MLSVTPYGMWYPLGQLESAILAVPPPSSTCTPGLLTVWEAEEALSLCKPCSALMKHPCVINSSQHKSKPQPHSSCSEEKQTQAQPNPAHLRTGCAAGDKEPHLAQPPQFGTSKFQSAVGIPVPCCSYGKKLLVLSSVGSDFWLGPNNNLEITQCEQCRLPKDKDNRV